MSQRSMHVGFPLRLDRRGRSAVVEFDAYVRGLIEMVLFTRPGERVNRPDFGSGVNGLVFAPSGDELARATQALVHGSLQQWLGELLRIEDVTVEAADATLDVTVSYSPLTAVPGQAERQSVTVRSAAGP